MGQKDLTEKNLEFYPDVFADLVNALLYEGQDVVLESGLQPAPTETLYPTKDSQLRNQFHDVSKYVMEHGKIKVQYTLENETSAKRRTVLRKAGYQGAVYRQEYDGGDVYPFISILLFWGRKRYKIPRSLKSLFRCDAKMDRYVDDCRLIMYEMSHLPKAVRERMHSDMRIVVDYLAEGKDYIPTKQRIKHLEALLLLLKALTGDVRYEEILPDMLEEEKKGEVTMCELLDKYENRGMERGIVQGLSQGIERVNKLNQYLLNAGRNEDIARAVLDRDYQQRLFVEFGL